MLPGFNTNVRHRGALFHVQSEDSGRAHPHIITHLYHGGTILFSEKSSYAELVDAPDLAARVRERMEAQHRAVLGRLRAGAFDETIRERLGAVLDDTKASTRPTATAPIDPPTAPPAASEARSKPKASEGRWPAARSEPQASEGRWPDAQSQPSVSGGAQPGARAALPASGAEQPAARGQPQAREAPETPHAAAEPARPFGESIVSAKPLDEVILEYLVENARKRRQKPAS